MLIDRTQRTWAWASFTILLVATASYVVYARTVPNGPHGGSVMGLIYGIIGTAFMVFAGLLAARKRVPHWRLGSAQFWLRGHLWLGMLSMPLILFHAGFGWGGLLENVLWILFGLVFLSGLFGLAVQQALPRILTTRIPLETFGAQIPYQSRRMQFLADRLVSETCGKLDLREEPMRATFKHLAEFGAKASREELPNWPDEVDSDLRALFLDLATHSKQSGWINKEDNFPKFLVEIYKDLVSEEAPPKKAAAAKPEGDGEQKPKAKASPLDQMKAKKAAAGVESAGEKKASPLDQMKAKAAKKKAGGAEGEGEKKLSPLEQMKAKAAAKKAAAANGNGSEEAAASEQVSAGALPPDSGRTLQFTSEQAELLAAQPEESAAESEARDDGPIMVPCPECGYELKLPDRSLLGRNARCPLCSYKFLLELPKKPKPVTAAQSPAKGSLSPLKQAMMQGAAAKEKAASGGTATAEKPLSPLEKMRAAKAAKTAPAPAAATAPAKKKKAALKVPKKKKKTFTGPIPRAGELREFYLRKIRPFLDVNSQSTPQLSVDAQSKRLFSQMRSDLPGELHETLNHLEEFVDERRQFSLQSRIHHWLHWWLFLHVPLSMGLYVLMIAHVIMALAVDPKQL